MMSKAVLKEINKIHAHESDGICASCYDKGVKAEREKTIKEIEEYKRMEVKDGKETGNYWIYLSMEEFKDLKNKIKEKERLQQGKDSLAIAIATIPRINSETSTTYSAEVPSSGLPITQVTINVNGAESGAKPKPRRLGSFMARISKFCSTCLSSLKWKFFVVVLEWQIKQWDKKERKNFEKYCMKGWHNPTTESIEIYGKRKVKVDYWKCRNHLCQWKFFTTAKQKQLYLRLTSEKRKWRK